MISIPESEILYELSLAVGNSLDLDTMLKEFSLTLLRVLNGRGCEVLQYSFTESGGLKEDGEWCTVVAMPRTVSMRASQQGPTLLLSHEALPSFYQSLPWTCTEGPITRYLFLLKGFGVLYFEKGGPVLSHSFLKSLQLLLDKLARSARACLLKGELESRMDAANKANRAKSEFFANMSHEMRTPLNGVIGYASLLQDSGLTAQQEHYARLIHKSGEDLLTLFSDILDLSRIEAGFVTLENHAFDFVDLVNGLASNMRKEAEAKGLGFACEIRKGVPDLVRGDASRLRQVLCILIGNAIKFTERGQVWISIQSRVHVGNQVVLEFRVGDTGISIPKEKQAQLFTKFCQLDASSTRRFGGLGLGLAIARELTVLMGGEIGVVSPVVHTRSDDSIFASGGPGSEFWFTYPVSTLQINQL